MWFRVLERCCTELVVHLLSDINDSHSDAVQEKKEKGERENLTFGIMLVSSFHSNISLLRFSLFSLGRLSANQAAKEL